MLSRPAALVAFAVVLSAFVHWADNLPNFLWAASVIVTIAFKFNAPLVTAMVSFTTLLIFLLAFITSSRLFVFAVLLPSILAAYTGKILMAFWLGVLVQHVWMLGPWSVASVFLQIIVVVGVKGAARFPKSHADAWSSILRPFNIDFEPIIACIQAYQTDIHPPILFLSQCLFHFFDKVVYTVDQSAKCIVWAFTQNYNWRPDWKIEEHARIRAEIDAERLRNKVPPAVARRQREEARRLWLEREQRAQSGPVETPGFRLSLVTPAPKHVHFNDEFLTTIYPISNRSSQQDESNQLAWQSFEAPSPSPAVHVPVKKIPVPTTAPSSIFAANVQSSARSWSNPNERL
ncbi:hypothetical protein F4678DRAFT_455850 [Xylaria arbuscula]|nr:hypothetical protein F4678DRAFT_455850 [Xylaria arbuscula]